MCLSYNRKITMVKSNALEMQYFLLLCYVLPNLADGVAS